MNRRAGDKERERTGVEREPREAFVEVHGENACLKLNYSRNVCGMR